MKHKLQILLALVLVLALAGGGVISAQTNEERKSIEHIFWYWRNQSETDGETTLNILCVMWADPSKTPADYRLSWTTRSHGWRSATKANTKTAGNAIVAGNRYCIGANNPITDAFSYKSARPNGSLAVPEGKTLRVRVRARYPGKKGPWVEEPARLKVRPQS